MPSSVPCKDPFVSRQWTLTVCPSYLADVSRLTSTLAQESSVYSKKAKKLSRQALIKKYTPLAVIVFILILVMVWRFW